MYIILKLIINNYNINKYFGYILVHKSFLMIEYL